MLRKMVRKGFARKEDRWSFKLTNEDILKICKTERLDHFVQKQKRRYLAHLIRSEDESTAKKMAFNDDPTQRQGCQKSFWKTIVEKEGCTSEAFIEMATQKKF